MSTPPPPLPGSFDYAKMSNEDFAREYAASIDRMMATPGAHKLDLPEEFHKAWHALTTTRTKKEELARAMIQPKRGPMSADYPPSAAFGGQVPHVLEEQTIEGVKDRRFGKP